MRDGMQSLLELLRKSGKAIEEAQLEAALTLAEEENVLGWAAACLRAREDPLTPAIAMRVEQIERNAAVAAFYWSSELKGVLRVMAQQGIAVVPLKGPFLAERLYGSAALRSNCDLDLLVGKEDLTRAEDVLIEFGFVPGLSDDYHRPWWRETTAVELHHDVENPLAFDFAVESALRRTRPAIFQGEACRQLAPEDELLFLCLHAARHRYDRLSLIVDLKLAFEKRAYGSAEWQPRKEVAGLDSLLTLGLAMARRLDPGLKVALPPAGSMWERRHLGRVADRLWERLLRQSREHLDWRTVHAFFVQIELPGWPRLRRRVRHLRILLTRIIEPDYAFAARLGLRRDWQVRALRPVRLLSEALRRDTVSWPTPSRSLNTSRPK